MSDLYVVYFLETNPGIRATSHVDGRLGDKIPPPAEPSIDGKTFTQQNQESKGNSRDG